MAKHVTETVAASITATWDFNVGAVTNINPGALLEVDGTTNVMRRVDTMTLLKSANSGSDVALMGFYSVGDGGGGRFYWDAAADMAEHNGGTIIDPTHSATPGTVAWYQAENAGTGCWVSTSLYDFNVLQFGMISGDDSSNGETNQAAWWSLITTLKANSKITIRGYFHFGTRLDTVALGKPTTWVDNIFIDGYGGTIVYEHVNSDSNLANLARFGYYTSAVDYDASNNVTILGITVKNVVTTPSIDMNAVSAFLFYAPSENIYLKDIYISRLPWYGLVFRTAGPGITKNVYMENIRLEEMAIGNNVFTGGQCPLAFGTHTYNEHDEDNCVKNLVMVNSTVDGRGWHANTAASYPTKLHQLDTAYFSNVTFSGEDENGGSEGMNLDGSINVKFSDCYFDLDAAFEIYSVDIVDGDGNFVSAVDDHNIVFENCVFENRVRGRVDLGATGGPDFKGITFRGCTFNNRLYHIPQGVWTFEDWKIIDCTIATATMPRFYGSNHLFRNVKLVCSENVANADAHRWYIDVSDSTFEDCEIQLFGGTQSRIYVQAAATGNTFKNTKLSNFIITSIDAAATDWVFDGCTFDYGTQNQTTWFRVNDEWRFESCRFIIPESALVNYVVIFGNGLENIKFLSNRLYLPSTHSIITIFHAASGVSVTDVAICNNIITQTPPRASSCSLVTYLLDSAVVMKNNVCDFSGGPQEREQFIAQPPGVLLKEQSPGGTAGGVRVPQEVPGTSVLQFGAGDFSFVWEGYAYNLGNNLQPIILFARNQGSTTSWFRLTISGHPQARFTFYHVSAGGTAYAYQTDGFFPLYDYKTIQCGMTIETQASGDRELKFYLNGELFETHTVDSGDPSDYDNTGSMNFGGDSRTDRTSNVFIGFTAFYNRVLSATEMEHVHRGGVAFADRWGSQTSIITGNDSDFAGASNWTNVDINAYDETGDLTITANAVGQWCTLPAANATTTVDKKYRLEMSVANLVSTWTIKSFTDDSIISGNDSTFAAASNWANTDINAYDATGDLTITANAIGQYCTLPTVNAWRTEGRVYRLRLTVANLVSTWTIKDEGGTETIGQIDSNGTLDFVFTAVAAGGLRIVSDAVDSSADIDNVLLYCEQPIGQIDSEGDLSFEFEAYTVGGLRIIADAADSSADIDDVFLYPIGAVCAYEPLGVQTVPGQWLDSSTNKVHALIPETAAIINGKPQSTFEVRGTVTWSGSHEEKDLTGTDTSTANPDQNVLPENCYIESILANITGTTIEDFVVGDGNTGNRWVTLTAGVGTGVTSLSLDNRILDGTNGRITVNPDADFTGSVALTVKGYILEA